MLADPATLDDTALWIQAENSAQSRLRIRSHVRGLGFGDTLPDFAGAVTAIWGACDAFVPQDILSDRRRLLHAVCPQARVHILPGTGHWLAYEAAERLNGILLDLLRRA